MQEDRTVDLPLSGLFANLRQEATLLIRNAPEPLLSALNQGPTCHSNAQPFR
jgi:hypothetical protein